MSTFVTLDEAKTHLREVWGVGDPNDADLQIKLDASESAIIRYLDDADLTGSWDATTVEPEVKASILLQTAELWRFRGDDPAADNAQRETNAGREANPYLDFQPVIVSLLRRLRQHSL